MMDDLEESMNNYDRAQWDTTYIKILLPDPATGRDRCQICQEAYMRNVRFP